MLAALGGLSASGPSLADESIPEFYSYSSFDYPVNFNTHVLPNLSIQVYQDQVVMGHSLFLDLFDCVDIPGSCIRFGEYTLFDPSSFDEGIYEREGKTIHVHRSEILLLGATLKGKRVSLQNEEANETFNFFLEL